MSVKTESEKQSGIETDKIPMNGNDEKKNEKGSILKQKRVWIPLLVIVIAILAVWYWYQGQIGFVSTDDAYIDGDKLSLASKMLGRITSLYADEGNNVRKGELLVRLDSTDLMAQRDQALISLKLSKDNIQLAQVNLNKAQNDFDRSKQQFEGKIIPKEEFDHAQSALQAAQAEFDISKTKISTAEAQLNVINTQLQNTSIYSPMNGVIAKRWVLKGDVVQPGQPIFSIYNLDSVWVTANLQETDLEDIKTGERVEVNVDSYPNDKFEGKVLQLGTNTASQFALIPPSNASGNFTKVTQRIPIKISVNQITNKGSNDKDVLLPGMSVEIKIKIK
ncbi:MAG TPA: HlyD family secretion protein [Ignavibacteriaceae bacterium]|nr:HlyD family secretion protein [Ignavibacteriaceae bacterium]